MAMAPFLTLFSQDPHYHETGGFGTDHSFGIGGEVYRVTNLNNEGEGSLRYGLELSGPRLIVFEVGCMINLAEKDLVINNGQCNLVVARGGIRMVNFGSAGVVDGAIAKVPGVGNGPLALRHTPGKDDRLPSRRARRSKVKAHAIYRDTGSDHTHRHRHIGYLVGRVVPHL